MNINLRALRSDVHSFKIENGRFLVFRNKVPKILFVYYPATEVITVLESEETNDHKLEQLTKKALAWSKNNIKI